MKVAKSKAKEIADTLGINLKIIPLNIWKKGLEIELEHGKINNLTNVTDNNLLKTGKIALAHVLEDIFYYQRLINLEKESKKFWKNKKMPSPLNQ